MNIGQKPLPGNIVQSLCEEQWSNNACCGYALIACKALGYSEKQIGEFLSALNNAFGNYSVERAKEKYMNY
jgi:hypothetical protein